jgi:hypothetical protein
MKDSWFDGYLQELASFLPIYTTEKPCKPWISAFDSKQIPQNDIILFVEQFLVTDFISDEFWKLLRSVKPGTKIVYLGHPSARKWIAQSVSKVVFPTPKFAENLRRLLGPNDPVFESSELDLPSNNVIPIWSFPGGVIQLVDYLQYLHHNQSSTSTRCTQITDREKPWICDICSYFHKSYDFE